MHSTQSVSPSNRSRAEEAFRAAFERLKCGAPLKLPLGTPVTQNNVAREAGNDPSALRKSRFPILVAEIQTWLTERAIACPVLTTSSQAASKSLAAKYEDLKLQRDLLASLLVEADAQILDLTRENERLSILLKAAGHEKKSGTDHAALKNPG